MCHITVTRARSMVTIGPVSMVTRARSMVTMGPVSLDDHDQDHHQADGHQHQQQGHEGDVGVVGDDDVFISHRIYTMFIFFIPL